MSFSCKFRADSCLFRARFVPRSFPVLIGSRSSPSSPRSSAVFPWSSRVRARCPSTLTPRAAPAATNGATGLGGSAVFDSGSGKRFWIFLRGAQRGRCARWVIAFGFSAGDGGAGLSLHHKGSGGPQCGFHIAGMEGRAHPGGEGGGFSRLRRGGGR
jgi:hypothetical protein